MKNLLVISMALMMSGCSFLGKPMTRLMPKIEKIDLPEELMKPPQELKLIIKPDIPPHVASIEIVRLQAIAAKLQMKATWMANVDKSDRAKKNLYYSEYNKNVKLLYSIIYKIFTTYTIF